MNRLKNLFNKLPPGVVTFVLPVIAAIVAGATAGLVTVRAALPGEQPGVVIVVPAEGEPPLVFEGRRDGGRPLLYMLARVKAASLYAKEHDLPFSAALQLARGVPDERITAAVAEAKLSMDGVPNVAGGPILDWIKANPEKFQQILQLILMLIPLFA